MLGSLFIFVVDMWYGAVVGLNPFQLVKSEPIHEFESHDSKRFALVAWVSNMIL